MVKEIVPLPPQRKLKAHVVLPGSKSITHRALIMAALSKGPCLIDHPLRAEDTELTAEALNKLGATVEWGEDQVKVTPPKKRWQTPNQSIWLGNSGTSARLLVALMAVGEGRFFLEGSPRLQQRPLGPVLDALQKQGVRIVFHGKPGYLPLELRSSGLKGGEIQVDASLSSQFLSAILIAAPCAKEDTIVKWWEPVASFPYVELTVAMMEEVGIGLRWQGKNQVYIPAHNFYPSFSYKVEADCSTASYFWAAAAVTGGEVLTTPLRPNSLQGDRRFLNVLEKMGCEIEWQEDGVCVKGPQRLRCVDIDMNAMPDMVPTLSVVAAFAEGETRIRNVAHLRIKESDRLRAVSEGLSKVGVKVKEFEDGLIIEGGNPHGAEIDTYDDHRIAMAFAVAGLRVKGIRILDPRVVCKSFPSFWDVFESMGYE